MGKACVPINMKDLTIMGTQALPILRPFSIELNQLISHRLFAALRGETRFNTIIYQLNGLLFGQLKSLRQRIEIFAHVTPKISRII